MNDENAITSGSIAAGSSPQATQDPSKAPPTADPGQKQSSSAPELEARIIEEIVIRPAPTASGPLVEPPPGKTVDAPTPLPRAAPLPAPVLPPVTQPASPIATPAPPAQVPRVEIPKAMPPPDAIEARTTEQKNIEEILKDIKLPQQRIEPAPQKPKIVFDTALHTENIAPAAKPEVVAPTRSVAPEPKSENQKQESPAPSAVSPLRTLKNDLQSIVREKKMSLVRAVTLEEEKRHHPSEDERENEEVHARRKRRTIRILSTAMLFMLLGAAAFFGVFVVMEERGGTSIGPPQSFILFAESGVPFSLEENAFELKRLLANARLSGNATLGSITRIIPTTLETTPKGTTVERPATLEEFLRALDMRVPNELTRALSQDFFFGLHTVDENAPLFVVPVVSYERAFAGMLAWEETLNADLSPVFTPLPDQMIGSGGLPEKRRFDDAIMRNYDVRVLKDDAGTIELYYSFPTRSLLVIAESPYSFTEILSRLRAERKL